MDDSKSIDAAHLVLEYADKLLNATTPPSIPSGFEGDEAFVAYHAKILELRALISTFAKGDFSPNILLRGFFAGSCKALQAHLRHMTWQVQQIEKGDYTQRIDFLGDFSTAFNNMVVQLSQTMVALRDKEEALTHLAVSLQKEVEKRSEVVQSLRESEAQFKYLAQHDPLTGALNRRSFFALVQVELEKNIARGNPCCLCLLDVDFFKKFNDTYGHLEGDKALKHIVLHGTASLRQSDVMGRYGGEEFIFFFSMADLEQGRGAAERIRQGIFNNPVILENGDPVVIAASLGVSVFLPEWGSDNNEPLLQHVIAQADAALYAAKSQGRNRVCTAEIAEPFYPFSNEKA